MNFMVIAAYGTGAPKEPAGHVKNFMSENCDWNTYDIKYFLESWVAYAEIEEENIQHNID